MQSMTRQRRAARARLRFRRASFEAATAALGVTSTLKRAEFLGLDKGTYTGVLSGRQDPGARVCAHVMYAVPGEPFERFFEVIEVETAADR